MGSPKVKDTSIISIASDVEPYDLNKSEYIRGPGPKGGTRQVSSCGSPSARGADEHRSFMLYEPASRSGAGSSAVSGTEKSTLRRRGTKAFIPGDMRSNCVSKRHAQEDGAAGSGVGPTKVRVPNAPGLTQEILSDHDRKLGRGNVTRPNESSSATAARPVNKYRFVGLKTAAGFQPTEPGKNAPKDLLSTEHTQKSTFSSQGPKTPEHFENLLQY